MAAAAQCKLYKSCICVRKPSFRYLQTYTSALETRWYIYTKYSTIKRNKLLIHATTWMDLKGTVMSKIIHLKRLHNV
jgi:hypothetical protein